MTEDKGASATLRVYRGILEDLEHHRVATGQRLVEKELADRFGVGRNAVREALQRLAARGVVDLSPHRSAAIRKLDVAETMEILDVAEVMTGLLARSAATNFDPKQHKSVLDDAMRNLSDSKNKDDFGAFGRARRGFYRALLLVSGNRELNRLFPAIGMQIIYSQIQSPKLQRVRATDYQAICSAVRSRDADLAESAGRAHVFRVREVIRELAS